MLPIEVYLTDNDIDFLKHTGETVVVNQYFKHSLPQTLLCVHSLPQLAGCGNRRANASTTVCHFWDST